MNAERGFELHPGAASDITSIWEFIAKDNPLAAKRVREDILDAIRRLVPFPHQGHQRRDLTSRPVRFSDGTQLSYRLRTRRRVAPCTLRARWSPKPTRARGHPPPPLPNFQKQRLFHCWLSKSMLSQQWA